MINFTLKSLLEEKGLSQTWLARKTGIRDATMSAIINNTIKEVSVSNIEKICDTLECTPGDFIVNISLADFEKRRSMISKGYHVPTTTREEREKMVNNALAISTLDAPEPTVFGKRLLDQFVEGTISEEEMLKTTLERYQL